MKSSPYYVAVFMLLLSACSPKQEPVQKDLPDGKGFFSVRLYLKDYEEYNMGQPYMFIKKRTLNGKTDSSMISIKELGWERIKAEFAKTDIGYAKYLDAYNFKTFTDPQSQTATFVYEAKVPEVKTKKLQIGTDIINDRVKFVFVDYEDKRPFVTLRQQLYFAPMRTITLNTETDYLIGIDKKEREEYNYIIGQ